MLKALKRESNLTYTENGALTNVSTYSDCLDLFATIGALRHASDEEIVDRFTRAFSEDPDKAMKILFFARDVRGGLGERRVFRTIMRSLAATYPESVAKNIEYFGEFGRFDDLLALMDTPLEKAVLEYIGRQLRSDLDCLAEGRQVSLLAKWLPSVNATNEVTVRTAKKIARALNMKDAEYRRVLSALRREIRILENYLRERDYSFDYEHQPSKAMFKYRAAFMRNDNERYSDFMNRVNAGEAKLNAGTIMPYELVDPLIGRWDDGSWARKLSEEEKAVFNTTWSALPDFGGIGNAIAVVDTSGSMYWGSNPTPASVALSLGLYFGERNRGAFHNHFIEFSRNARLIEIKGETFYDRLRYVASFSEVANTDLEAVFTLILRAAVKNRVPQEEMPEALYIISDMEFDSCVNSAGLTNFENAKRMFERCGYRLPNVIFWNVNSRNQQMPVTVNDRGVALVSGCNPRLFSMIAAGEIDPVKIMNEIVMSERYEKIAA